MTYEEISSMWVKDAIIDETNLSRESLKIPVLHSKYYHMYLDFKYAYDKLKSGLEKFEVFLEDYILDSMTADECDRFQEMCNRANIPLPDRNKKVLKPDVAKRVKSHPYVIEQHLRLVDFTNRMDLIKSILSMISSRSFQIRDAIEFQKFMHGN